MPPFPHTHLPERGVVAVTGPDAVSFLDNLATNALDALPTGDARFAALLTPQGKIMFEFFALRTAEGFLLDTLKMKSTELIKRLTLYKLRAKVTIAKDARSVAVSETSHGHCFNDPRHVDLGFRCISNTPPMGDQRAYHAHRIALGVAEAGRDYPLGDTFPHEANYDLNHGVSFTKGCFVGQEVVARMQNKTVVRKRVVKVVGASPLIEGLPILIGDAEIGRIGSVDGNSALAMLRLDRASEAHNKSQNLTAGGVAVTPDPTALAHYSQSLRDRPVIDL